MEGQRQPQRKQARSESDSQEVGDDESWLEPPYSVARVHLAGLDAGWRERKEGSRRAPRCSVCVPARTDFSLMRARVSGKNTVCGRA